MTVNLAQRRLEPELMDQPGLSEDLHRQALSALGRVNRLSRSVAIVWPAICDLAGPRSGRPLRVLDIASGGGDVAVGIARRAARAGMDIQIDGCDISPYAVRHAQQTAETAGLRTAHFFEFNALADSLPDGEYDVVMCSLFLHHLTESDAVVLLRKMSQAARHLVLVNDLRRTRTGYLLAWLVCRLLTRSPIVHTDGPLSVGAAFTPEEILDLARQSGLDGVQLSLRWPQRFLLTWTRP